jgi:hypothetical protein
MCDHEGQPCPRHCRCECMNCQFGNEELADRIVSMSYSAKVDALVHEGG